MARVSGPGRSTCSGFLTCLQCPDLEAAGQASRLCLGDPVLHVAHHHVSGLSCLVQAILGREHVSSLWGSAHPGVEMPRKASWARHHFQVPGDGTLLRRGLCIGKRQFCSFVLELVALLVFTSSLVFLTLSPGAWGGHRRAAPLLVLPFVVARVTSGPTCPGLVLHHGLSRSWDSPDFCGMTLLPACLVLLFGPRGEPKPSVCLSLAAGN